MDNSSPEGGPPGPEPARAKRPRVNPVITRRAFVGGAMGLTAFAYLRPGQLVKVAMPRAVRLVDDTTNPGSGINPVTGGLTPDLVISAERQADLVLLDFAFYGFALQAGTPPTIVPTTPDNTIVVQFAPQAIGEGIYSWHGDDLQVDPPPVLSDLSGPSRLCFNLTTSQTVPLPTMTVADLLDWSNWALVVPPVAQVNGPTLILGGGGGDATIPVPAAPGPLETAIEFPYALFLAPVVYASGLPIDGFTTGFAGRLEPLVSPAGVVDLWSSSLVGSSIPAALENVPYVPQVSAVWSDDYDPFTVTAGPPIIVPDDTPEEYIEYVNEVIP